MGRPNIRQDFSHRRRCEKSKKFSNRDHTTVIHAVKKIDELIKKDNEIRQSVADLKKKLL